MAALFWTSILALQLAVGLAVAGWYARGRSPSPAVIALIVLAVCVALTTVAVALSFATAAAATRASGAPLKMAAWRRAFLKELRHFCGAWLSMIIEGLLPEATDTRAPHRSTAECRPVLLLHGLGCNRGVWRPLLARLRAAGFAPVRAINLQPCGDLQNQAARAAQELRLLAQQAEGRAVDVVAHSMGGLVARAMLRLVEPYRIGRIVTIGTPHQGTQLARWLPCAGARQMRPDSSWLRALNAEQAGRLPVPLLGIYSLEDNIVVPASSAAWGGAQPYALHGLGHFGLLRSHEALDAVAAALGQSRPRRMHGL